MYVLSGINNEFVEIEMIEINKIKKRSKKYNYFLIVFDCSLFFVFRLFHLSLLLLIYSLFRLIRYYVTYY